MSTFKVYGVSGISHHKLVRNVDYFEVEEGGALVFYQIPDHHDGKGVKLGEVAEPEGRAASAVNNWDYVEEVE